MSIWDPSKRSVIGSEFLVSLFSDYDGVLSSDAEGTQAFSSCLRQSNSQLDSAYLMYFSGFLSNFCLHVGAQK